MNKEFKRQHRAPGMDENKQNAINKMKEARLKGISGVQLMKNERKEEDFDGGVIKNNFDKKLEDDFIDDDGEDHGYVFEDEDEEDITPQKEIKTDKKNSILNFIPQMAAAKKSESRQKADKALQKKADLLFSSIMNQIDVDDLGSENEARPKINEIIQQGNLTNNASMQYLYNTNNNNSNKKKSGNTLLNNYAINPSIAPNINKLLEQSKENLNGNKSNTVRSDYNNNSENSNNNKTNRLKHINDDLEEYDLNIAHFEDSNDTNNSNNPNKNETMMDIENDDYDNIQKTNIQKTIEKNNQNILCGREKVAVNPVSTLSSSKRSRNELEANVKVNASTNNNILAGRSVNANKNLTNSSNKVGTPSSIANDTNQLLTPIKNMNFNDPNSSAKNHNYNTITNSNSNYASSYSSNSAAMTVQNSGISYRNQENKGSLPSNPDGSICIYWLDMIEENLQAKNSKTTANNVIIFGKIYEPATKTFNSISLILKNIFRTLYIIPKENKETGARYSLDSVKHEFEELRRTKFNHISNIKTKTTTKKYCFELPIPHGCHDCLEIKYDSNLGVIPGNLNAKTFDYIFGKNSSLLEIVLLEKNIRGPSWLKIEKDGFKECKNFHHTWCCYEIEIENFVKNLSLLNISNNNNNLPNFIINNPSYDYLKYPPPLNVLSISTKTIMINNVQEIYAICATYIDRFILEDEKGENEAQNIIPIIAVRKVDHPHIKLDFIERIKSHQQFKGSIFIIAHNEKAILNQFINKIAQYDPDVIIGHKLYSEHLDLLINKISKLKIDNWSKIGRMKRETLPKFLQSNSSSNSANFLIRSCTFGRLLCDTLLSCKDVLKENNYDLDYLSDKVLKLNLQVLDPNKVYARDFEPLNPMAAVSGADGSDHIDSLNKFEARNLEKLDLLRDLLMGILKESIHSYYLMNKLSILSLTKELTTIGGNLWIKSLQNSRADRCEMLLMHEFYINNYILPDKLNKLEKEELEENEENQFGQSGGNKRKPQYLGGLVLEPLADLYDSIVLLLDFNSLYPSIIQEYNICFTTVKRKPSQQFNYRDSNEAFLTRKTTKNQKNKSNRRGQNARNHNEENNRMDIENDGASDLSNNKNIKEEENKENNNEEDLFDNEMALVNIDDYDNDADINQFNLEIIKKTEEASILPAILKSLVQKRRDIKELMKYEKDKIKKDLLEIKQKAVKLSANSLYGYLGFKNSRFYAKAIAALITSTGRNILMNTVKLVESKFNLQVIYGDTDSIMINTLVHDINSAIEIGNKIKRSVNEKYKLLEMELDGIFKTLLLLKKKKYAALKYEAPFGSESKTAKEYKGLDLVRRDWCELSRQVGIYILDIILSGKSKDEVTNLILEFLKQVGETMNKEVGSAQDAYSYKMFEITKQITKNIEDYADSKNLPHVRVAKRLKEKGDLSIKVNSFIPYIVCVEKKPENVSNEMNIENNSNENDNCLHIINPKNLSDRCFHESEIMQNPHLKIDIEWYKGNQIIASVTRLCKHISQIDMHQLASCIGLDSQKYSSYLNSKNKNNEYEDFNAHLNNKNSYNGFLKYQSKQKLQVKCSNCGIVKILDRAYSGKNNINYLYNCESCKRYIKNSVVFNNVMLQMKKNMLNYFNGNKACIKCKEVTRLFIRARCNQPECRNGMLRKQISENDIANEMNFLYYQTGCNVKLDDFDKRSESRIRDLAQESGKIQMQIENIYKEGIAVPFIIYDKNTQTFNLNPQCENIIKNLNNEFGVVSICGIQGLGKSFLLDKMLLQYKSGFTSNTNNPIIDKKGIWLWSKPLLGYNTEGKTMDILLLDSKLFPNNSEFIEDNARIYSLIYILSSLFIYNSIGEIDENTLKQLSFLAKIQDILDNEANNNSNDKKFDLQDTYPDFLWILRDFNYTNIKELIPMDISKLYSNTNLNTSEYMEKKLNDISKISNLNDNFMLPDKNSGAKNPDYLNSNDIYEKMKKYFIKRECFMMLSPLLDEANNSNNVNSSLNTSSIMNVISPRKSAAYQGFQERTGVINKDKLDWSTLPDEKIRPEFLAQVLSLRKKICSGCKIKTFNSLKLSANNYLFLISEYLNIFNSGNLPSLNDIWDKFCEMENRRAFEVAESSYLDHLKKNIGKKPLDSDEISNIHDVAKERCLELYRRNSIGDMSSSLKKSLKKKIDEKLNEFTSINDEENKTEIINFLKNQFDKVEMKIKNNEINTIEDVQKEIDEIENKIKMIFPNTNSKSELILDFKNKLVIYSVTYILSKNNKEINMKRERLEEERKSFASQKMIYEDEIKQKGIKISQLDMAVNGLREQINRIGEKSVLLDKDKEKTIQLFEEKINKIKEDNLKIVNDLNEKISYLEKKNLEKDIKSYEIREEYEKERATLIIKIEYLNKTVEEYTKKEKDHNTELQNKMKESNVINKNTLNNYENKISELNKITIDLKEKIMDLENNLTKKENILEQSEMKIQDITKKYLTEKSELLSRYSSTKAQYENLRLQTFQENNEKDSEILKLKTLLREKENDFEEKTKQNEEGLKSQIMRLEKELSLEKQSKDFLKLKCDELQINCNDLKKSYDNLFSSVNKNVLDENDEYKEKNNMLLSSMELEKKQIEENFEKIKKNLINEIDALNNKMKLMENKNKASSSEAEKSIKELKEINERLRADILLLQKAKAKLEDEKSKISDEANFKYKKILEEFEKRFEEKDKSHKKELDNFNKNYDETITHYKLLFETEKTRLEERNKDERTKYEKKTRMMQEEYESKIREIEKENKIEVSQCKEEYEDLEQNYQKYIIKSDLEIKNLTEKVQELELILKQEKENFYNAQAQYSINYDKNNQIFNNDRKEFLKKLENLNKEISNKDQEITSIKCKKDFTEKESEKYALKLQKEKENFELLNNALKEENENLKKQLQEASDEGNFKKLEFIRENELLKQQIEFLNKTVEEYKKMKEKQEEAKDDFYVSTRKQIELDFINKIENLKNEKEDMNAKLNLKKKELRDLEQAFLKQTCIHDKEKQTLNEKITLFENKKKEIMEYYRNAIEVINQETTGMREDFEKEINEKEKIIEKLTSRISELEKENNSFISNKSNMKTKVGLLETQLEENKKFISEVQTKFENILTNQKNKNETELQRQENEYNQKIMDLKQNYENIIHEMEEDFNQKLMEMTKENEDLEEELNSLSRQTQANLKVSDPNLISKKISELLAIQTSLKKEIEQIKFEKEKKISEITSNFEREKEKLNLKILDLQLIIKDYEQLGFNKNIMNSNPNSNTSAKNSSITKLSSVNNYITGNNSNNNFNEHYNNNKTSGTNLNNLNNNNIEFEKEKNKWNVERENLKNNVGDLTVKIDNLENKIEILLRENEHLKLTYLEENHSPIHNYRVSNANNLISNPNSFLRKTSQSNSIIGSNPTESNPNVNNFNNINHNFLNNKKNSFTLNMQMNMSSPIGKQEQLGKLEPNLFSDTSEIGEYNMCYDINSPQVNITPEKNIDYFTNKTPRVNSNIAPNNKYISSSNNIPKIPNNNTNSGAALNKMQLSDIENNRKKK